MTYFNEKRPISCIHEKRPTKETCIHTKIPSKGPTFMKRNLQKRLTKRPLNIGAVLSGRGDLLSDQTHTSMKRDLYSWKEICIHEKTPTKKTCIHDKTPLKRHIFMERHPQKRPTKRRGTFWVARLTMRQKRPMFMERHYRKRPMFMQKYHQKRPTRRYGTFWVAWLAFIASLQQVFSWI